MRSANFVIVSSAADRVIIRDVGPWEIYPTVTNDAERVVDALAETLEGRRLFYFDSDGELDELIVKDGRFAGFRPAQREARL